MNLRVLLPSLLILTACIPRNSSKLQITGGTLVEEGSPVAKHTIALVDDSGSPYCTGSILEKNIFLTASHCLVGRTSVKIAIGLGVGDAAPKTFTGYPVQHEEFRPSSGTTSSFNDIALVKVEDINLPSSVLPVTLGSPGDVKPGEKVILAGYGRIGLTEQNSDRKLFQTHGTIAEIDEQRKIITYTTTDGSSACFGDSGGPMYVSRAGKLLQVGITRGPDLSDANSKACKGRGEYTNATKFLGWIAEKKLSPVVKPSTEISAFDRSTLTQYKWTACYNSIHIEMDFVNQVDGNLSFKQSNYFRKDCGGADKQFRGESSGTVVSVSEQTMMLEGGNGAATAYPLIRENREIFSFKKEPVVFLPVVNVEPW